MPRLAGQQEIVRGVESLFAPAEQMAARFRTGSGVDVQFAPFLLAHGFAAKLVEETKSEGLRKWLDDSTKRRRVRDVDVAVDICSSTIGA